MHRDTIIRLAREAGVIDEFDDMFPRMERFAALVAAHEREACAKVCEKDGLLWGHRCAAAIRSMT